MQNRMEEETLTIYLHHLILAFIIRNQIIFVYIHKYIHALYTRKMVPITGRASSFLEFLFNECMLIERKRRRGRLNNNYRAINFPRLYNSSQTTSPQPNTNFYHTQSILCQHSIYIHIYICIINCSIHNAFY